jgi:transcriptional regulator with XRE-family HTH domain
VGNPCPRPKHLAKKLLAIREHLGLSQIRLVMAMRLEGELAYHRISEYETGRRMPSLMVTLAYARAAAIPMEYLADDEVDLQAFRNYLTLANARGAN